MEFPRVLVVGAGGIGCELLKNLALTGFKEIDVVDLDTIELSNLNRQFLFRQRHIGRSKAIIALEAVLKMVPSCHINAHFGNIADTIKFPLEFFSQFGIILNALDNLAARRYVNQIALALNIPLVESGTTGYFGQTSVILGRRTECFDCNPKETPKTYPVCTIRSTPSTLVHCVVWAKEFLFSKLFRLSCQVAPPPNELSGESEELRETWRKEEESFLKIKELKSDPRLYFESVFKKVFNEDISELVKIKDLWKDKTLPVCLELEELEEGREEELKGGEMNDHEIWPLNIWVSLFESSIKRLLTRNDANEELYFDKDDQDTLDLIASAANIRAKIFSIPMNSRFEIKAIAGNIIPAISTTNAIAAGMIVIQALNIIRRAYQDLSNAYITYGIPRKNLIVKEEVCTPNPQCAVCAVDRGLLRVNCDEFNLSSIFTSIIPKYFSDLKCTFSEYNVDFDDNDIMIIEGSRLICDADDEPEKLARSLRQIGIVDSKFIRIDFGKNRPLTLAITHDQNKIGQEFSIELDLIEPKIVEEGRGEGGEGLKDEGKEGTVLVGEEDEGEEGTVLVGEEDEEVQVVEPRKRIKTENSK